MRPKRERVLTPTLYKWEELTPTHRYSSSVQARIFLNIR
jgi:hypothetical protein